MRFNDTAPVMPKPEGPPPWLAVLADDATLQGAALKQPVTGKSTILALIKEAIPLYDFQKFTYRGPVGDNFFLESYHATVQGKPLECAVWVHYNAEGKADSIVINHYPLDAALMFSRLMGERVGTRYGDLYLID